MTPPQPPPVATRGEVLAVCRTHEVRADAGAVGSTGIDKRPAAGPVRVGALGLEGDVIRDTEHHGGLDKAVYAYGQDGADAWGQRLGVPVALGGFGENLRLAGIDVDGAVIGERWQVGEPGVGPVLEVAQPRIPCQTFARFVQATQGESEATARWVRQFTQVGLPGAYLRVESGGVVKAGDAVEVLSSPAHGVSVAGWFTIGSGGGSGEGTDSARALLDAGATGQLRLAEGLRDSAEKVLARGA